MDDLSRADADLKGAEAFLIDFVRDDDLVRFIPFANDGAVEVIVVHLEEDVVFGIAIVEHPLQEVTLGEHAGKRKCARGGSDPVEDEVSALANERISFMLPSARLIPFGH